MHWTERYVGLPYRINEFDCAHLLAQVQLEVFGIDVSLPEERDEGVFALSAQIDRNITDYLVPIERHEGQDGDVVLMKCKNRLNHTGVLAKIDGVDYVLHNLRSIMAVALHKVKDLPRYNIEVEGYYRFKFKKV